LSFPDRGRSVFCPRPGGSFCFRQGSVAHGRGRGIRLSARLHRLRRPRSRPLFQYLYGIGTYVDVKVTPWIQFEGEGRWLRFNQVDGIYEDNYLIGPRLPIYRLHFWHATPYGKVLIGYGKLNFENGNGWGRYTQLSYGGGLDIKMSKRINLRLPDFEYQQWLNWTEGTGKSYNLFPYGVSVGVSYRVLG
jgi:hypothetical protein